MPLFGKTMMVIVVALVMFLGAGDLWSTEIDAVEGRTWDPGSVQKDGSENQIPVFKRGLDQHVGTGKDGPPVSCRDQKKARFEVFLNDVLSFLDH